MRALTWQSAPRLRRLATVALIAVAAAVVTGRAGLLLLAAPALAVLAISRARPGPAAVDLAAVMSSSRCFEGEDVELSVTLGSPQALDEITLEFEPADTVSLVPGAGGQTVLRGDRAEAQWVLRPSVWGRRTPGRIAVRCRSAGLWQADLDLSPPALEIFPYPPPTRAWLVPAELRRRIGDHTARSPGSGVEFSGIREYVPGDRLRDLNWAVSARRGKLHTNQRAAERAADLIVMIDGFSAVGPPGHNSIDVSVRGAAAVAHAYLGAGDRVGAVALGGMLRWLSPGSSRRQFYQIAEMLFGIWTESAVTPDLDRVPRTALPPGALVIMFTPLLDQRVIGAITDLRERGFALVVVDVLRHEPPVTARSQMSALALRLWRLDRDALQVSLAGLGVPVVRWAADQELDAALAPMRRVMALARRP